LHKSAGKHRKNKFGGFEMNEDGQFVADENREETRNKPTATPDQECWIKARIETAMRMAIRLHKEMKVQADSNSFDYAVKGIAEGTALEIINLLNIQPSFKNIRRINEVSFW
jgi:hypothetical protein